MTSISKNTIITKTDELPPSLNPIRWEGNVSKKVKFNCNQIEIYCDKYGFNSLPATDV